MSDASGSAGAVRRATKGDGAAVSASLASAFGEDPVFRWLSGQDHTEARMTPFWKALVKVGLRSPDHLMFVWNDGEGASFWRPVDGWKVGNGEVLRAAPGMISALRLRLPVALRYLAGMEKAHPHEPHYYLEFLGTRADRQGHGGGSALLQPMLDRCDDEGTAGYLESSNPRNVPFYARHGFVPGEPLVAVAGAPPVTPMWRDPR